MARLDFLPTMALPPWEFFITSWCRSYSFIPFSLRLCINIAPCSPTPINQSLFFMRHYYNIAVTVTACAYSHRRNLSKFVLVTIVPWPDVFIRLALYHCFAVRFGECSYCLSFFSISMRLLFCPLVLLMPFCCSFTALATLNLGTSVMPNNLSVTISWFFCFFPTKKSIIESPTEENQAQLISGTTLRLTCKHPHSPF